MVFAAGSALAHLAQHLAGQVKIIECVDQQRLIAIGDEARIAPAPAAVRGQPGVGTARQWVQAGAYPCRHAD
jgi:hypothetical protein